MVANLAGCANFKRLGKDLEDIERDHGVSVRLKNKDEFSTPTYCGVVEWDRKGTGGIRTVDFAKVENIGVATFLVERTSNQHLFAFNDENNNTDYDPGEAAWFHGADRNEPVPIHFKSGQRSASTSGLLSRTVILPDAMLTATSRFIGSSAAMDVATKRNVPLGIGEVVSLDDPRFAADRGIDGIWQPASFPLELGIGVFFLEEYDPNRIPVLFVYGASGSPQEWRTFFRKFDKETYQPWFFFYPTGQRLDTMGTALNEQVKLLHSRFGFKRLDVVAHSMGGMVARSFVVKNSIRDGQPYIKKFVTLSTPWNGHAAAIMGVKRAPSVVPSWRDMVVDSPFQQELFASKLKGRVDHLLIYGDRSKRSPILPKENDGTVSVESMTYRGAVSDAVDVVRFNADHGEIIQLGSVVKRVETFLGKR